MKHKVYGHLVRMVKYDEISETLDKFGKDGYKLVSVVLSPAGSFIVFMIKEYIEND